VIGRHYFTRQAVILFKFAQATTDPKVAAALIEKAADLKLQVDEPGARPDPTPSALDIVPPVAPARRRLMPSSLKLNSDYNNAIRTEIGHRLRMLLSKEQPRLSSHVQHLLDRLNRRDEDPRTRSN
jgi:hypothetical protein